jgi:hypothetical protein
MLPYDEKLIVPSRADREAAAEAWVAHSIASEAVGQVRSALMARSYQSMLDANEALHRSSKISTAAYYERRQEIYAALDEESEMVSAYEQEDLTERQMAEFEVSVTLGRDDRVLRCALSGVVLFDSDETLDASSGDESVLRCLVLRPRSRPQEERDYGEEEVFYQP